MDLQIVIAPNLEITPQIYRQILDAIVDRRLARGDRLPPTRELARQLQVSRNTVSLAYDLLIADGVLIGRTGDGTFVNAPPQTAARRRSAPVGKIQVREVWRALPELSGSGGSPQVYDYDFGVGVPDSALFPFDEWRRLMAGEFRARPSQSYYQSPAGDPALRAALAKHVGVSRAVQAEVDDVIITQGAQQAFDLISRVLLSEGAVVAIEDPGYANARLLFRTHGARVAPVPVDEEGIVVSRIPRNAKFVYVTPSHQFPLGHVMSFQRRTELLAWAERTGAVIIEDDYDSEFRFGGRPLDPLQSMDRIGCVVYVGTLSKVMLPTLRLGFLISPASLRSALLKAKKLSDWHSDSGKQGAAARFIRRGMLAKHIRKLNRVYAERHALIVSTIEKKLSRWLQPVPSSAGIHLSALFRPEARDLSPQKILAAAGARGVKITSLADYYSQPANAALHPGLVFGFGAIGTHLIEEGLHRLTACCGEAQLTSQQRATE